jgi:hypothetical protein
VVWYAYNPAHGSNQYFAISNCNKCDGVQNGVAASGTYVGTLESSSETGSNTSGVSAGSLTVTGTDFVVATVATVDHNLVSPAFSGGFSVLNKFASNSGNWAGGAISFLSTSSTVNPACSWAGTITSGMLCGGFAFK